jgi:hypothetical protein
VKVDYNTAITVWARDGTLRDVAICAADTAETVGALVIAAVHGTRDFQLSLLQAPAYMNMGAPVVDERAFFKVAMAFGSFASWAPCGACPRGVWQRTYGEPTPPREVGPHRCPSCREWHRNMVRRTGANPYA